MRFYDDKVLVYDSETGFRMDSITPEALEALGGTERMALEYIDKLDLIVPIDKRKPLTDNTIVTEPNWVISDVSNADKRDMAIAGITRILTTKGVEFNSSDVEAIVDAPVKAYNQRDTLVPKALLIYAKGRPQALDKLNSRVLVDDASYPYANVSKPQTSSTDEIGIRLPEADIIASHEIGTEYDSTPYSEYNLKYPNILYKTSSIASILSANTAASMRAAIEAAIEHSGLIGRKLSSDQQRKVLSSFDKMPLEHVIGDTQNDTIPILPHEEAFYNNLREFIRFHIGLFNREFLRGSSQEEIDAKTEEDYKKGNLPLRLTEYLVRLIEDIGREQFYHTGNFNYIEGDLDDDDEREAAADEDQKLQVVVSKEDRTASDLQYVIQNYLTLSAEELGADVWAEGIVKLMRVREYKIRNLNVGINNTQFLDIQALRTVTQQVSDFTNYEAITDENGATLEVTAVTFCDIVPEGETRPVSVPYLFIGTETGEIPGQSGEVYVDYITTIFDVVREYELGNPLIYDITYNAETGKFVDEYTDRPRLTERSFEVVVNAIREQRAIKIKVIDEILEFAIENKVSADATSHRSQGTAYALINAEQLEEYGEITHLVDQLVETPPQFRNFVLTGSFLKMFALAAKDFDSTNLVEILNWYKETLYPIHVEAYKRMLGIKDNADDSTKINVRNKAASNLFGTLGPVDSEQTVELEDEGEKPFMYNVYEGDLPKFQKIIYKNADNAVAGVATLPDGSRLFASVDEIGEFDINTAPANLGTFLIAMFGTAVSADTGNQLSARTKVVSADTFAKVYTSIARS